MSCTVEQTEFLENLRLHLIDLSRRLEQDSGDDVADYVLYRLQQVARHLSRIAASAPGNVFEEVQLSLSEITSVLEDAERSWLPCILCCTFHWIGWSSQVRNKQRSA